MNNEEILADHEMAQTFIDSVQALVKRGLDEFLEKHRDTQVLEAVTRALDTRLATVQLVLDLYPMLRLTAHAVPVDDPTDPDGFKPVKLFELRFGKATASFPLPENPNN